MASGGAYEVLSCPSCGAPLQGDANAVSCGYCGVQLARAASPGADTASPTPSGSPAIEAVRLRGAAVPADWVELGFAYVTAEQCTHFAHSFGGPVHALANQLFNVAGKKLQVNYVDAGSVDGARAVFDSLVRLGGKVNTVTRTGTVASEIICSDHKTIALVLAALRPEQTHDHSHRGRW